MIPRSLSATSISVFEACPARWEAEYFLRGAQANNAAAELGTAAHKALELFIRDGHYQRRDSFTALSRLFDDAYDELFGERGQRYEDGVAMMARWHARQDWTDRVVISTEKKSEFMLPTSAGPIPFRYIWDRCDLIEGPHQARGEEVIEVIDYKSWLKNVPPGGLKDKIQVRVYGLAAAIQFPQATRIWVTLDQLRYDSVGIVFSREQNIATWEYLIKTAERIIATGSRTTGSLPPMLARPRMGRPAEEKINPECGYCIRKTGCATLASNVAAGGVHAITDVYEAAKRKLLLESAAKAAGYAVEQLDAMIMAHCEEQELLDLDEDPDVEVHIYAGSKRGVDGERVLGVIGEDLFTQYGKGPDITMEKFDKLLKDPSLTAEQRARLQMLVQRNVTAAKVKVEARNPIDRG